MPYRFRSILLLCFGLLTAAAARADVVVLVHGWASDASTWDRHGFSGALHAAGWHDGGATLQPAPPTITRNGRPVFVRAQLPANAPLSVQADVLGRQVQGIRQRYPVDTLYLVGHSAGGLVARLALLHSATGPVAGLVSIATPNLGTPRAVQGLQLLDDKPPFCPGPGIDFVKEWLIGPEYGYLRRSRQILHEMTPNTLTQWLNHQAHPPIRYLSITHVLPGRQGDDLVPAFSQDLTRVTALRGMATNLTLVAAHELSPADAQAVVQFITPSR